MPVGSLPVYRVRLPVVFRLYQTLFEGQALVAYQCSLAPAELRKFTAQLA